jgi:hypothetical protein
MIVSQLSVVSFAADEIVNTEQPVTVEETQDEAQPEEAAASVAETAGAAEETAQEIPAAPAPVKKAAKKAGTKASFNKSKTVDGVKVTVKAGKGVFPRGSKLSVKKVSVPAAVDTENAAETYAFDISIISGGKKIQPDGKAKVSFTTSEVADKNLETAVYHMDGKTPEELKVAESGETAAVTTTGFSVFVLTFCFEKNTYTYNLPDTGKVSVKNILKTIAPNWEDYTYSEAVLNANKRKASRAAARVNE